MKNEELQARLDDMQRQLNKLFEYHGQNWEAIERQRKANAEAAAHAQAVYSVR